MTTFELQLERDGVLIYPNKGTSMLPLIRQGRDLMVIKKLNKRPRKYDAVLFIRADGKYVLHRIQKVYNDGSYYIIGDNCTTGETVKEDQIIGILTEVKRGEKGKSIMSSDIKYKLYARFILLILPLRKLVAKIRWKLAKQP